MTKNIEFFDINGRCLPDNVTSPVHTKIRRYFTLDQPEINYQEIRQRIQHVFPSRTILPADEFESRIRSILQKLADDASSKNILNGTWVPFIVPQTNISDPGESLEQLYLPAVEKAFKHKFPDYSFINHNKMELSRALSVIDGSRHERMLQAVQENDVIGCYFPCITEYSIPAAIEKIKQLPEYFWLAGACDTSAALIGSPELLIKKTGYPPLLWLTALAEKEADVGYHYEAYGYDLTFNRRHHFNMPAESWASGIVVTG